MSRPKRNSAVVVDESLRELGVDPASRPDRKRRSAARDKPKLPNLDPNDAAIWRQAAKNAQEGNAKLARGIDILRQGLQELAFAEVDFSTKPPTPMSAAMFRTAIAEILDQWSALSGQNWRVPRNQVVKTRAGTADGAHGKNQGLDGSDYD